MNLNSWNKQSNFMHHKRCGSRHLTVLIFVAFVVCSPLACQKGNSVDLTQRRMDQFIGATLSALVDSIGLSPEKFIASDEEGVLMECLLDYSSNDRVLLIAIKQPPKTAICFNCQWLFQQVRNEVIDTIEVLDLTKDPFRELYDTTQ